MAAARVGGGQQDDPQSRRVGRLGDGERHRVRLVVRRAVRLVVHVVELADRAVAGGGHLAIDAPGHVAHSGGIEPAGELVHALAPAPEVVVRAAGPLAAPAQVALERVRVHVGHGRDRVRPHASFSTAVSSALAADGGVLERHVLLRRVADPGLVAHEHHARRARARRSRPRRGRRSRRSAASAAAGRPAAPRARPRGTRSRATTRRSAARASRPPARPRSSASAVTASRHDSTVSASGARASSHMRARDGTVVGAFGSTSSRPVVNTIPRRCAASLSARTMMRAAAASASWRSSRGVVPAWSARPESSICRRSRAASRVTTPAALQPEATSRVWSTCSSRKPRSFSSHCGASAQPVGVDARVGHRVGERDAVVVDAVEHVVDVEPPDQCARAERRRVEARALLVGERDHRDRRVLGDRERGGHAERAVEAPAGAHAVQVRAGRPPRAGRVRDRPQVARGVALHRAADRARAAREPAGRLLVLARPREPRGAAVLVEPDRDQVGQQLLELRRRHRSLPRSPPRPGCGRSGRGCARPARRAARGRRACRPRSSRGRRSPSTQAALWVHAASASRAVQP